MFHMIMGLEKIIWEQRFAQISGAQNTAQMGQSLAAYDNYNGKKYEA